MRNVALIVQYDGTDFRGFAAQQGQRTVQGTLSERLERLLKHPVQVIGAGRTDAGAHALGQTVNFETDRAVPIERLAGILNKMLPDDLVVRSAKVVPETFNARFSAIKRYYRYSVLNRPAPSPFLGRFAYHVARRLDVSRMNEAAQALIGRHDFAAFTLEPAGSRNFEREIFEAKVVRTEEFVRFHITGTAFLRGMIRLITGVLIKSGLAKRPTDDLRKMLAEPAGERARWVTPACGLCLMKVTYDWDTGLRERFDPIVQPLEDSCIEPSSYEK